MKLHRRLLERLTHVRGYARLGDLHTIDDTLLVFSVFLVDGLLYISEGAER